MATPTREGQLIEAFVTLADTLVVGYDVVDLLHTLVSQCLPLFGASAAGIILTDGDAFQVVATTDEPNRLVEILLGSGPGVESIDSGRAVGVADIGASGPRWPQLRAGALEQGYQSMFSVPLRLRATTIGSLTLFWELTGGLRTADAPTVQALADVATIGILQERALRESDVARKQLQYALNSRVVIEQAKGVVAYTRGATMDAAFALMRQHARSQRLPLAEVAARIISGDLAL